MIRFIGFQLLFVVYFIVLFFSLFVLQGLSLFMILVVGNKEVSIKIVHYYLLFFV